ncbi:MAG: hypothetical protein C6Y20_09185 [Tagaea sp. CACIAM 22H2]|nr:hypothetical protein [Tagaea sp. CACIAM 22H2]
MSSLDGETPGSSSKIQQVKFGLGQEHLAILDGELRDGESKSEALRRLLCKFNDQKTFDRFGQFSGQKQIEIKIESLLNYLQKPDERLEMLARQVERLAVQLRQFRQEKNVHSKWTQGDLVAVLVVTFCFGGMLTLILTMLYRP